MESIGRRRVLGALALGLAATLAGCGSGNNDNGTAQVRLVNASPGYASLDFYLDSSTTASISNVATGAASDYINVSSGAHASTLDPNGTTTVAQSQSRTFAGGNSYTILAAGWQGALYTFQLTDNEPAPDSGQAKVRVINAAQDAGPVDVYVTAANDALTSTTPDNGGTAIVVNSLTNYVEHPAGTYRIRVTPSGDKLDADVLLDLPNITLSDQQITTIVLVPTSGGVLVNAIQMDQKGAVTPHDNPLGRVRLVNALGSGSATATVGGTALAATPAHVVGSYTSITASAQAPVTLTGNGVTLTVPNQAIAAGGDYTLLVYGDPAAPQFSVLADDNRLPTTANKANVRLVNGLNVSAGTPGLSLVENSKMYVSSVAPGAASSYVSIDSSNGAGVEFDVDSASQTLYTKTAVVPANGVFTIWLMGDANAPIGTLLSDR
jgi:hypothetical protein